MNEKILLLVTFLLSLVGLLGLFFLSERLEYDEQTIEKINAERMQEMVKIKGEVVRVTALENVTFISVQQPSSIDVIVFENISVFEGEQVEVIGKGEEYKGEMEIIAHRIRVIQ